MKIKVNATQRPGAIGLAKYNGDMPVESDSMPKLWSAALVRLNGFIQQRFQRFLEFIRSFLNADDIFVIRLQGGCDLLLERFSSHSRDITHKKGLK